LLERVLVIEEASYAKEHVEVAITSFNLAAVNKTLQKYDVAYL